MDNDQLVEFLKVTDGFSDIDVSKIICALQVIRKSRFNVSKLLRFILENTFDDIEKEEIINIIGSMIETIKDIEECKYGLIKFERHMKTWYNHLESYTFSNIMCELKYYLEHNEAMRKNETISDYLDYLSVVDVIETEEFVLDGDKVRVCGIKPNGALRFMVLGKVWKTSKLYSMVYIQKGKVYRIEKINSLQEEEEIVRRLKRDGFELLLFSSGLSDEAYMINSIMLNRE